MVRCASRCRAIAKAASSRRSSRKHERRFTGFDQKIIAMYARGMTVREIQGYLAEMYGTEVSPDFISKVTDEVTAGDHRLAEPAAGADVSGGVLRCPAREDPRRRDRAQQGGVSGAGGAARTARATCWASGSSRPKAPSSGSKSSTSCSSRGVNDILIAVVDGLKGLSEAIETAFPRTTVQTCIVHLIRNSLDYASWKDRKAVAAALRPIYTAATAEAAAEALEEFAASQPWGVKHPTIVQSWKRAWQNVIPFFAFRLRCVGSSTPPTSSRACTCSCARSSRAEVTSPAMRRPPSCYGSPCAISPTGKVRSTREWRGAMNEFAVMYGTGLPIRRTEINPPHRP